MLWSDIEDGHQKVLVHPFITGLGDGTLPHAAFGHYITQDAHYLRTYARVFALCAAKACTSFLLATAYGAPGFPSVVAEVLDTTDRLAGEAPEAERELMRNRTAARYERMFWDAAHRQEQWPA